MRQAMLGLALVIGMVGLTGCGDSKPAAVSSRWPDSETIGREAARAARRGLEEAGKAGRGFINEAVPSMPDAETLGRKTAEAARGAVEKAKEFGRGFINGLRNRGN